MENNKFATIAYLFLMLFTMGCSHPIQTMSHWNENGIKIDGMDDDWDMKNLEVVKESKIAVGLANDEKYLYLSVAPLDRGVAMQIMTMGFTAWFDSTGRGDKIFGIRYPIGFEGAMLPMSLHERGQSGDPFEEITKGKSNEVEIIGPGKLDRTRLTFHELIGITLKLSHQKNGMFYELRVPLRTLGKYPYAINAKNERSISILLETGEFKKPQFSGDMPRGGMQRGGGIPGGGRPMGERHELPKQLKVLLITTLAKQ